MFRVPRFPPLQGHDTEFGEGIFHKSVHTFCLAFCSKIHSWMFCASGRIMKWSISHDFLMTIHWLSWLGISVMGINLLFRKFSPSMKNTPGPIKQPIWKDTLNLAPQEVDRKRIFDRARSFPTEKKIRDFFTNVGGNTEWAPFPTGYSSKAAKTATHTQKIISCPTTPCLQCKLAN